jgi:general secretion pathway protein D
MVCPARAQEQVGGDEGMIKLNLPEKLELKVLIDYVSKRNKINFIYDGTLLAGKSVTLIAPQEIPAASLMTLLESVLKMKGMSIVRNETGMLRIQMTKSVVEASSRITDQAVDRPERLTQSVTRVVTLEHADFAEVEKVLKPFLSTPTANVTQLPQQNRMIMTDYASNMGRLMELIELVDQPRRDVVVRFAPVKNLKASEIVADVRSLLEGKAKAGGARVAAADVTLIADARTNRVVMIGAEAKIGEAMELLESLDVALPGEKKIYSFRVAGAGRVDQLVRNFIGNTAAEQFYNAVVDADSNVLIVTAPKDIHEQIERIVEIVDQPVPETQSPIRFYKLENAKATDVLSALQNIEGEEGLEDVTVDGSSSQEQDKEELVLRGPRPGDVNRPAALAGALRPGASGSEAVELPDARVMAYEPTNTIIIIAKPAMQQLYARLIEQLDVRRPQVLVEVTVVTLDTSDGFSLGVEISHNDETNDGEGTVLNFSSFGLSTVDAATGRLSINPGIGFNGALISADLADAVIRALQSDSRAKVVSRPNLLINDNATGSLTSEIEEPYSSLNASDTVATTSFAGYSSAGTKVNISPQISEGNHLKLEYTITLSSFGEDVSETLPPSRQTNSLASEATIPDGHTIIVGGLTREDFSETVDRVPFLGEIPVLEYIFSNRDKSQRRTTLFVFLRAVILRDDKFDHLKSLSAEAVRQAKLTSPYPESEPVEIP